VNGAWISGRNDAEMIPSALLCGGVGDGGVRVPGFSHWPGGAEVDGSADRLIAGVRDEINVGGGQRAVEEAYA
jgi:hypothetical protein